MSDIVMVFTCLLPVMRLETHENSLHVVNAESSARLGCFDTSARIAVYKRCDLANLTFLDPWITSPFIITVDTILLSTQPLSLQATTHPANSTIPPLARHESRVVRFPQELETTSRLTEGFQSYPGTSLAPRFNKDACLLKV